MNQKDLYRIRLTNTMIATVFFVLGFVVVGFFVEKSDWPTWIFYFAMIAISYLAIFCFGKSSTNNRLFLIITWVCMLIPIGFRYMMAMDDASYQYIFKQVSRMGFADLLTNGNEIGFLLVEKVISIVTQDYYISQIIYFMIAITILMIAILKFKEILFLPIVFLGFYMILYFKFMSAGLNRMFFALTFVLFALYSMYRINVKQYIIWVILAFIFHRSALILLLFIPIFFQGFLGRAIGKLYSLMIPILTVVVAILFPYVAVFLSGRYVGYGNTSLSIHFSIATIIQIVFLGVLLYLKKYIPEGATKDFYYKLLIISWFGFWVDLFLSSSALGRIVYYCDLATILCVGVAYKYSLNNKIFFMFTSGYYYGIFCFTILFMQSNYDSLFPFLSLMEYLN